LAMAVGNHVEQQGAVRRNRVVGEIGIGDTPGTASPATCLRSRGLKRQGGMDKVAPQAGCTLRSCSFWRIGRRRGSRSEAQTSVFSAISSASSTSTPR
jgi:hypothetical protein